MYRVSPFVRRFAWALLGGAGLATLWVNLAPERYYDFIEWRLFDRPLPGWVAGETFLVTPMSLVSDGLMALFLFFIGKELWEALVLERGALRGRRALLPAGALCGGILGAVLVWTLWSGLFETAPEAEGAVGWPVPIGADVVIGYMIGRRLFGASHPALHFLLLTAIGSNIAGLLVLGLAFPGSGLKLLWLALPLAAAVLVWRSYGRGLAPDAPERLQRRRLAIWPYMLAGLASWFGVAAAGLPPALGLLPILPAIPHADRAFGMFAEAEEFLHDPLNRLAHLMVKPLAVILFAFGLTRGGVDLAALAPTTGTLLVALWIGKPIGMMAGAVATAALFRLTLPKGIGWRDMAAIAILSGVGFTLPVLAIDTALPGGAMAEAARLGAALSLLIWPAIALARQARPDRAA